ncbi:T9SS type A sorting domain-containing protein [Mesonia aestuariivivens]|uniref:T9SS type A sorting domain-containing protein n=1 Tax=Mesonia aestuariivivens TaxID=2796128 RepID=A0ABS6VY10_9FLAO|nr:T9SS type A sorting domain-containing protein [Mesonia aestuariivivens]MBW2960477.1 T9SS type A sorting domain-containing protein [Mesonia aestuariivivens]
MKKITLLFALMISLISFGQTPIITMIADGDCSGGNPKVVEIYADGAVDFSLYSIEKQSNGGSWGTTTSLSSFGTVTDDFIYVYSDSSSPELFPSEYPSASNVLNDGVVNVNGDDGIRIILDSDSSVIDQYGVDAVDGTGEFWEYKDGYAKRNTGTTANGSFNQGDWTFYNLALDGQGSCQGGNTFESIIGIASFTPGTVSCPLTLSITDVTCDNVTSGTDTYTVTGTFQGGGTETYNFVINEGTITSTDDPDTMASGNIVVTGIPEGTDFTYTITSTSCSITNTITSPECEPSTNVSSIADLRAGTIGETYTLTSEAVLTYQQSNRNQKYIEDATAAILIDDSEGNITTTYSIGDGITGVTGELSSYNGVLQFVPETDPGAATSTGLTVSPQIVTIAEFTNNYADYESEMIAFENVSFTDADGTVTFATASNYMLSNGTDQITMRTNFWDADYIDEVIPTNTLNVVGIAAQFDNGTDPVTPQIFATDVNATLAADKFTTSQFSLYPNPASNGFVSIQTKTTGAVNVEVYNLLGKRVLAAKNINSQLNVSALTTGVYLVKVSQDGVSATKKLIVK